MIKTPRVQSSQCACNTVYTLWKRDGDEIVERKKKIARSSALINLNRIPQPQCTLARKWLIYGHVSRVNARSFSLSFNAAPISSSRSFSLVYSSIPLSVYLPSFYSLLSFFFTVTFSHVLSLLKFSSFSISVLLPLLTCFYLYLLLVLFSLFLPFFHLLLFLLLQFSIPSFTFSINLILFFYQTRCLLEFAPQFSLSSFSKNLFWIYRYFITFTVFLGPTFLFHILLLCSSSSADLNHPVSDTKCTYLFNVFFCIPFANQSNQFTLYMYCTLNNVQCSFTSQMHV